MRTIEHRGGRALVTGASSGIGEAFARALAARGSDLVLVARRKERLEALAAELSEKYEVKATVVAADLARTGEPRRAFEEAAAAGPITLLVNNAGFGLQGRFEELPIERLAEMIRLNDEALTVLCRLALPPMRERGAGAVINVASVVGFLPLPQYAAYAASKAYVLSLSEALDREMDESGVRVMALCPGSTPTEFFDVAGGSMPKGGVGRLTAQDVVRIALEGLEAGKIVVVPGVANSLTSMLPRLFPRKLVTKIAAAFSAKMR